MLDGYQCTNLRPRHNQSYTNFLKNINHNHCTQSYLLECWRIGGKGFVEVNEIEDEEEEVHDDDQDEGNLEEEREDPTEKRQQIIRKLIRNDYLVSEVEVTLELDSNEEFGNLNQGQEAFAILEGV